MARLGRTFDVGDVMAVPGEFAGSRRRRGVTRLLHFTSVLRSQPQQKNVTQRDVLESVTG